MGAEAIRSWLVARYEEDEQVALAAINQGGRGRAGEGMWHLCLSDALPGLIGDMSGGVVTYGADGSPNGHRAAHIARHDPARVLREVAAKRRRLERHQWMSNGSCGGCWGHDNAAWPCPDIVEDAQSYAPTQLPFSVSPTDFPAELTLPDAIAVTLVREAVERQERANHPVVTPLASVRFTEDGHTEVFQRTGASVTLPTGTWTRLERYP